MTSPYDGIPESQWQQVTQSLVNKHPLNEQTLVDVVLSAWQDIFTSRLGAKPYIIGTDILPTPQIMGFLLEAFICLRLADLYPNDWRQGQKGSDKDLVYIPDDSCSVEIKTSSDATHIFGNRSYAQQASPGNTQKLKKTKSGYYLAVNFEKFVGSTAPAINIIRFGWLDHADWKGQASQSGQQAKLSDVTEKTKLLEIYRKP